jgi:flagellar hook-basal body complex protein FliE
MSIAPITIQPPVAPAIDSATTRPAKSGADLGEAFEHALHQARELEHQSTQASEAFANGDPSMGIHEVMIATEKANLAVRYTTTLKNKALEAYRELMNTQV